VPPAFRNGRHGREHSWVCLSGIFKQKIKKNNFSGERVVLPGMTSRFQTLRDRVHGIRPGRTCARHRGMLLFRLPDRRAPVQSVRVCRAGHLQHGFVLKLASSARGRVQITGGPPAELQHFQACRSPALFPAGGHHNVPAINLYGRLLCCENLPATTVRPGSRARRHSLGNDCRILRRQKMGRANGRMAAPFWNKFSARRSTSFKKQVACFVTPVPRRPIPGNGRRLRGNNEKTWDTTALQPLGRKIRPSGSGKPPPRSIGRENGGVRPPQFCRAKCTGHGRFFL